MPSLGEHVWGVDWVPAPAPAPDRQLQEVGLASELVLVSAQRRELNLLWARLPLPQSRASQRIVER